MLGVLGVDGRTVLEKYDVRMWAGYGPVAGCCEHGNGPSGFKKGREFSD